MLPPIVQRILPKVLPQSVLNWKEARFYSLHGEIELRLLDILCDPQRDAIDIGANDGCYVLELHKYVPRVIAYEPLPALAANLRKKFRHTPSVEVRETAISNQIGTAELHLPLLNNDGKSVGLATIDTAAIAANYPASRTFKVAMSTLDKDYTGHVGFIKIDVEGHQQAVLDGALNTIQRCQPRMLVEAEERLSPGGFDRVKAFFKALNYSGYYVHDGALKPIAQYSVAELQNPANLPNLNGDARGWRFGNYLYNFIWLPAKEPASTLDRLSARLSRL